MDDDDSYEPALERLTREIAVTNYETNRILVRIEKLMGWILAALCFIGVSVYLR